MSGKSGKNDLLIWQCHKIPHKSRDKAFKHAKDLQARKRSGSRGLVPYLCGACGYWHVGHEKTTKERLRYRD